uniref:enoyl-CoA hydratase/isomerase family protein n=1 Tax=Ramlibacter sp. TaxID=1917967 RepID=UPI002FC6D95D
MPDQPPVRLDIDAAGIATITLNRPEQLNAFDLKMIEAWRSALETAEADERVKVVVVTGAGRAFCAGGDFEEMARFSEMNGLDRKNFLYRN